ncbi:MAG: hypothetical protein KH123_09070, partial [Azospirillum sp.]|nr:hypothetical protein [Azospirillum sp.]
ASHASSLESKLSAVAPLPLFAKIFKDLSDKNNKFLLFLLSDTRLNYVPLCFLTTSINPMLFSLSF